MDKKLLDIYSDYLIAQNHYATATGLSELLDGQISHDKITRFLNSKETTSKDLWEYTKPHIRKIEQDTGGVLILDDIIEEKTYTDENEIICWHYSHAKKRCIKGVNLLSCLVRYGDIALPIACDPVYKDVHFCDVKTKKEKRRSSVNKNEMFRSIIAQAVKNEIQFDYVRFPDGTASANSKLNFHNTYKESKAAAIQGFLQYAKEELSPKHVYVAADMFAWPIVACDDQDIGQFLPAIANVVDIICPMPYLDHFSNGSFNIDDPVEKPYDTLYAFTKISDEQLKSIKYPSKYLT